MIFQDSLGIEIRNNSVLMVYLKGTYGGIRIAAHALYSLEENRPLSEKTDSVPALISDFQAEQQIRKTDIWMGIPQELTLSREIAFPLAVKENLRATLSYEMEKHIPLPADELYYDSQVIEEKKSLNRMTVLLLAAKKSSLAPYIACCKKLSGRICGLEGISTARANFYAFVSEGNKKAHEIKEEEILRKAGIPSADFIPAFGLALKGLQAVPLEINLLPENLRKKPSRFAYYMMSGLALMVLLAGLGWGGSYLWRQHQAVRALNAEMKELGKEVAEIENIQRRMEDLESRISRFRNLRQGYIPLVDIMRELTAIIPESAWVQDFSFTEKGIQLNGFADSASDLIGILEASPLFSDVSFLSAIVKGRDGKERFSIGLKTENMPESGEMVHE